MTKKRRQHTAQCKFRVALEATWGQQAISQIGSKNNIHPNQVGQWKRRLLKEGPAVFNGRPSRQQQTPANREAELYEQIGRLKNLS